MSGLTTIAIGRPCRVIVISSPSATRFRTSGRAARASLMVITAIKQIVHQCTNIGNLRFWLAPLPDLQGGELLDVVPGPDLGDHLRIGRAGLGDLLAEFVQVVLMAWRGDEEQHAGRDGPRVGEGDLRRFVEDTER